MYMYIYVYIYMYICIYVYIYLYVSVCVCNIKLLHTTKGRSAVLQVNSFCKRLQKQMIITHEGPAVWSLQLFLLKHVRSPHFAIREWSRLWDGKSSTGTTHQFLLPCPVLHASAMPVFSVCILSSLQFSSCCPPLASFGWTYGSSNRNYPKSQGKPTALMKKHHTRPDASQSQIIVCLHGARCGLLESQQFGGSWI